MTEPKTSTWQPIVTAPKDRRIRLWMKHGEKHGKWNPDTFARKNPKPYWDYAGERIMYSRGNPPSHWMDVADAPN